MPNPNRGSVGFQSNEFDQEYERPSKSELKRQVNELQKLGEQLVDEPRDRVKRVPMPDDVKDAILECQTITNHEGRRRQLQFVGKKMRSLTEEEVDVIRRTIDSWKGASKAETAEGLPRDLPDPQGPGQEAEAGCCRRRRGSAG